MSTCPFEVGDVVRDSEEFMAAERRTNDPDVGVVTSVIAHDGGQDGWTVYGYWRQSGTWRGILSAQSSHLESHPDPESIWPEYMAWMLTR